MSQPKWTYLKISVLLHISLISIVIFLWNRSGIVPMMIFYSAGPNVVIFFGFVMMVFGAIIQGIAYMLYRGIYKNKR